MDRAAALAKWEFTSVLPYIPPSQATDPFTHMYLTCSPQKLGQFDKKAFEEDLESTCSQDSMHSDLLEVSYSASQSVRTSSAGPGEMPPRRSSRRQSNVSFGLASNTASRPSEVNSELASFIAEEEENRDRSPSPMAESRNPSILKADDPALVALNVEEPPLHQEAEPPLAEPDKQSREGEEQKHSTPVVEDKKENQSLARASFLTSPNFSSDSESDEPIPQEPRARNAHPEPIPEHPAPIHLPKMKRNRPESLITSGSDDQERCKLAELGRPTDQNHVMTGRKHRKPNAAGDDVSMMSDNEEIYRVSTFIPRCTFPPAEIFPAEISQKMVVNLPGLQVAHISLVAGQQILNFLNEGGYITGHILRAQRYKVAVRIHVNEHNFSQGDYFFVPVGNSLTIVNKSERMSAILQLVITKQM